MTEWLWTVKNHDCIKIANSRSMCAGDQTVPRGTVNTLAGSLLIESPRTSLLERENFARLACRDAKDDR